jgi:hypothetical protein
MLREKVFSLLEARSQMRIEVSRFAQFPFRFVFIRILSRLEMLRAAFQSLVNGQSYIPLKIRTT